MKATVTPEAESAIVDISRRHGLSREAVLAMLLAVHAGGGTMAQFSLPELGGSGQWMRGGMTMVGNMFDNALKARVDALCGELAQLLSTTAVFPATTASSQFAGFTSDNWWPADLGVPSASGGQNDERYAVFPSTHRLAIQAKGVTRVFDTGEHRIGGVQQQQGGGPGSASFTSQLGTFDISSLRELGAQQVAESRTAAPQYQADSTPPAAPPTPEAASSTSENPATIIGAIESLAGLHQRGIVTDEEFTAKKAELLGRL
ncbi:SHOCT domain-containing protein [Mycolicibacterium hodleri]|uniref:SHOCT domain-containing protein n=1 Tax=Mycolicibacterium hodleri TaxID=49897 RepID=A0A502E781_9MYCO|nr:SHOCT domain-containing protein [Mycolicibacterium hodleri]TPG32819.1 SHOCT domain-containing protein [Mycolicibacterium hodleri]